MRILLQNFEPKRSSLLTRRIRCVIAFLSVLGLLTTAFAVGAAAGSEQKRKGKDQENRFTEELHIMHVLNRLGFGARPGDIERVRAIGVQKYIEQQLNPGGISDEVGEARVKNLTTLSMTTAQLYEKYPRPGQIMRQLQRRGDLPTDQASGAEDQKESRSQKTNATESMPRQLNDNPNAPGRNEENRRAIREYYAQNGLLPPQRIMMELQASRILRATYSERQLQEVLVDFWTNHFNIFSGKGADRWLLVSYDRDTIRPHTTGKFHDLLLATAQSPAMLFYLDNFQSVSPNAPAAGRQGAPSSTVLGGLLGVGRNARRPRGAGDGRLRERNSEMGQPGGANVPQPAATTARQRRGINENYARELMELHTLGVEGGYTQKDVQEVARCFTGWTIFAPRGGGATGALTGGRRAEMLRENAGKFFFNERAHDDGEKIVLGHKVPAGGGMKDGLMVIDILAHHPATAKFIATKLARYFVSDTPPPDLVDRAAAAFSKSDGDIRETLRTIFFSREFNSPEAYRSKVKRPFELAISALRTLGAETTGGPQLHQWIARMGEPLYGFQTPNGYSDTAASWVNTGGLLERLNFGLALASNRIPGTRVNLQRLAGEAANGETADKSKLMDQFLTIIIAGNASAKTRETLLKQLNQDVSISPSPARSDMAKVADDALEDTPDEMPGEMPANITSGREARPRGRQLARMDANITDPVTKIVGLILGSPEFQRQ